MLGLWTQTNSPTKFAPTEFTPTEFTPTEFTPTEFTPTEAQASIDDVTPAPTQPHQLPPPATAGHSVFHSDDPVRRPDPSSVDVSVRTFAKRKP
jgi:hypothetical protein